MNKPEKWLVKFRKLEQEAEIMLEGWQNVRD